MSEILRTVNTYRWALMISLVLMCGGGGGPTGTSSTGELRLAGYVKQSGGERVSFTPMVVRSGTDDEELLTASTDAQGDFEMSLPPAEMAVAVEIGGKRTRPVPRSFSGSSVLSIVVTQGPKGDLETSGSFEVRIASDSLCASLRSEDNDLLIQGDISSPCLVQLNVISSEYPLSTFNATLEGACGSENSPIINSSANPGGEISIDISEASLRGCVPSRISLSSSQDSSRGVEILIR